MELTSGGHILTHFLAQMWATCRHSHDDRRDASIGEEKHQFCQTFGNKRTVSKILSNFYQLHLAPYYVVHWEYTSVMQELRQ